MHETEGGATVFPGIATYIIYRTDTTVLEYDGKGADGVAFSTAKVVCGVLSKSIYTVKPL